MVKSTSYVKSPTATGATIKDVAARAGVSTATVSRVLSGKEGVSEELYLRVRDAIEKLDYRPNQAARRLRERQSKIIGALVPDIQIPFFSTLVVQMERVLQEAGYLLLLGNTFDQLQEELLNVSIFLSEDVSGVIFAAANSHDLSNIIRLQENGIPVVAIDRSTGELQVDSVQIANIQAAKLAVDHLLEEGHQEIALITGPQHISTAFERQNGYELALRNAGRPVNPKLVQDGNYLMDGGYLAMRNLMERRDRPSAILVANYVMTMGALQYIHEKSIEVPDEISLISFDDMPWSVAIRPPLTAIAQPVEEIGRIAAQLMLDRIRMPSNSTKHIILEAKLIIRSSCLCSILSTRPARPTISDQSIEIRLG
jgi:LacI family transcriptional regulator